MSIANFPVGPCNSLATGSNACVGVKLGIVIHSLFLVGSGPIRIGTAPLL